MRHNKKRNTAFIYESLIKELTKAIVNKDAQKKNTIFSLIQECFVPSSPLAEELVLYKTLLETKNIQPQIAEKLLYETKAAHSKLDSRQVFDAQSQLISKINKNLGGDVWANFVANYKSLASINAIFNTKTAVKTRVLFEQGIVDAMAGGETTPASAMKPIDNLTYRSFIEKFNNRYHTLLQEQKDLLNRFITSFADDGFELRVYLNEELRRLKGVLIGVTESETTGALVKEKTAAVLDQLEDLRKREFVDSDLQKVLKVQELAQELSRHD